jgi:hypothetical protein
LGEFAMVYDGGHIVGSRRFFLVVEAANMLGSTI